MTRSPVRVIGEVEPGGETGRGNLLADIEQLRVVEATDLSYGRL